MSMNRKILDNRNWEPDGRHSWTVPHPVPLCQPFAMLYVLYVCSLVHPLKHICMLVKMDTIMDDSRIMLFCNWYYETII
jgi:hypothetical protein